MKKIKQMLRLLGMAFFISLAAFGASNILPVYRERFLDKEIKTEQVERRDDDEPSDDEAVQ